MQFLSQSIGWEDCLVLAMAPLGIITVIVSAIRVGGPDFLRAFIGRARESRALVEMELMSSTSDEVCELNADSYDFYTNSGIVRCQGSAAVWQFMFLRPKGLEDWSPEDGQGPKLKFMTLAEAFETKLLKETQGQHIAPVWYRYLLTQ